MALRHKSGMLTFGEYQTALTESVYPMRLDLADSASKFGARLALARMGSIDMVRAHAGTSFHCIQQPAGREATEPRLILKLQLKGSTSYRHVDRALHCNAGDIAIFNDANIIEGEQHGAADALVIKLPVARVQMAAPAVLRCTGGTISSQTSSGRLLAMNLREMWAMAQQGIASSPDKLLSALLCLLDASLAENNDTGGRPHHARDDERYRRLCELVAERCTNPDFPIATLAKDLAMSRSTMYDMVKTAGTTIERMVSEARVNKAMAFLCDAAHADKTITTLAYELGFKHPSHLTRAFVTLTGESPMAFRRRYQAQLTGTTARRH